MADPLRFPAPPMPGPARRGALGTVADMLSATAEGLSVREVPFPALLTVRGTAVERELPAAVRGAVRIDLPGTPNTVHRSEEASVLWLGPHEWLIVGPSGQEDVLYRKILEKLPREAALTDVTDSRVVLEVAGSLARDVLAKGCPIDLHPNGLPPGSCAQTLLGQVPVLLESVDGRPTFRLFVRPSVGRFVAAWLMDAASEF